MTRRKLRLALVVAALGASTLEARRRGYHLGAHTVVRCRRGHLFTTVWIPGVSVKAIRLGWVRFQHCPVGRHWTLVTPVRGADLSPAQQERARATHDVRLP